jgi:hypothetical protein
LIGGAGCGRFISCYMSSPSRRVAAGGKNGSGVGVGEEGDKAVAAGVICTPTLRYGLVFIIHLIIIIVAFTVPTAPGVRQTIPPTANPTANPTVKPTTRSPTPS